MFGEINLTVVAGAALIGVLLVAAVWLSRLGKAKKASMPSGMTRTAPDNYAPARREARVMAVSADGATRMDAGSEIGSAPSPSEAHTKLVDAATRSFGASRDSVVIRIVHHGAHQCVDNETAIEVMDVLRKVGRDARVDVVLHTPGGGVSATQQILHALKSHRGQITAYVPYRAMSAGTMIALACDKIMMGPSAVLGPIDPQVYGMPAKLLSELLDEKNVDRISDDMVIISKMARQSASETRRFACEYVNSAHMTGDSCSLTDDLIGGGRTHGYPILPHEAASLGLTVGTDVSEDVFTICKSPPEEEGMFFISMSDRQLDPLKAVKSIEKNRFL
jgi:hypothetical protein